MKNFLNKQILTMKLEGGTKEQIQKLQQIASSESFTQLDFAKTREVSATLINYLGCIDVKVSDNDYGLKYHFNVDGIDVATSTCIETMEDFIYNFINN